MKKITYLVAIAFLMAGPAWAHKKAPHEKAPAREAVVPAKPPDYGSVNAAYLKNVKPIFVQKCFDCHSDRTQYPWYYPIPGVKQLIDDDIDTGREHVDYSNDFPFGGHGTPDEDLEALVNVVKENSMPPLRYKLLHWDSWLTEQDRKAIHEWIQRSREKRD